MNLETVAQGQAGDSQPSPAPPQIQSLGSSWFNTSPAPVEVPDTAAPTLVENPSSELAPAPEITVAPPSLDVATIAPETPVTHALVDTVSASAEVTDTPLAAVDVVEDTAPDDALMVKVVEDVPTLDAAAAVMSEDSSPLQGSILGAEAPAALPSAPGLAQVSVTPPTQFYSVVCPKCGADVPKPAKVWELKGGKSKKNVLIGLFQCQDCRVKFREALSREII